MGRSNPKNLKPAVLSHLDTRLCEAGSGLRFYGSFCAAPTEICLYVHNADRPWLKHGFSCGFLFSFIVFAVVQRYKIEKTREGVAV